MFMHNGQIGGYQRLRRRLESMIPDRYYGHRVGTTDSAVLFFLLFANGLEDDAAGALTASLPQVHGVMAGAGGGVALCFPAAPRRGRTVLPLPHPTEPGPMGRTPR